MHIVDGPERHIALELPSTEFEFPATPLTGSSISLPDVVPPTPPLEEAESEANGTIRIQEDYGFPEVAEVIGIENNVASSFLKPTSLFPMSNVEQIAHPARVRRKKALLIGIKYDGVTAPVEGAHNDVEDMKHFLIDHYGWWEDDIFILKDDGDTTPQPTRDNIISEMHNLVRDACAGDQLFVHFSGHGGQVVDTDGDEADGMDEVIFSCDKRPIVDDELNDILVKPLPAGCRLMAVFDCCSSGTSLDLPVIESSLSNENKLPALSIPLTIVDPEGEQIVSPASGDGSILDLAHRYGVPSTTPESPPTPEFGVGAYPTAPGLHKSSAGNVIMWSSCQDSERSYEVMATSDRKMKGAMTHAFIECLKDRKRQTYRELLDALSETLVLWRCPQRPLMSSAHHVNMRDIVSL